VELGALESGVRGGARPFVVAHRAGNSIADLRAAELLGGALVETDVRLYRGRLEVRHLRTLGPLPILWDRWRLDAPWRPRLTLAELLVETAPTTELMLDLKGRGRRVGEETLRVLVPWLGTRRLTVCARRWELLEPFAGHPVRRVYSIGTPRQLRRFLIRFATTPIDGVSVHERLLHRQSIESLRSIAAVVMTWPVNRPARAQELVGLGVDGLITDDVAALSRHGVLGSSA
jgi:glycerophosphoryl diester phosphodiesterase